MKKRILIPCLLLAGSLTACDSGMVTKGVPYKEGDAAKVSEALKAEKKDSLKAIKFESTATVEMTAKASGEKESVKATADLVAKVDLEGKTIDMDVKSAAKGSGQSVSYKASAKAKDNGSGVMTVTSTDGDYAQISSDFDFDGIYVNATFGIYSWNFTLGTSELDSVVSQIGSDMKGLVDDLSANILLDGDVEKGTFDVGISKEITGKINAGGSDIGASMNMNFTITKMKYTFKDCLLRSSIIEMKANADYSIFGESASLEYVISNELDVSYTTK